VIQVEHELLDTQRRAGFPVQLPLNTTSTSHYLTTLTPLVKKTKVGIFIKIYNYTNIK